MPGRNENPWPIQDEISFKELVLLLGIPAVTMKEKRKEKTTRNIVVAKRSTTKELNREFTQIRMAEEITTSAPEVDLTGIEFTCEQRRFSYGFTFIINLGNMFPDFTLSMLGFFLFLIDKLLNCD